MPSTITPEIVSQFKAAVMSACPSIITKKDHHAVRSIPNQVFADILRDVFDSDIDLARDVIYNRVEKLRNSSAHTKIASLPGMNEGANLLTKTVSSNTPILMISDIDNDGSISQAIAIEARKLMGVNISVEGKDYDPTNHGFSINQIDQFLFNNNLPQNASFTILVVDLGTNQRETQEAFLKRYPNANLLIIDHHEPDYENKVNPNTVRSLLISPYNEKEAELSLKNGGGVSSGYLLYTLFKSTIEKLKLEGKLNLDGKDLNTSLEPMLELARAANLLDMVNCDIRLKPLNEHAIQTALDVSSSTRAGRSLSKWLNEEQVNALRALAPLIGEEAVSDFLKIRDELIAQNNIAKVLYENIPKVLDESQESIYEVISVAAAQTEHSTTAQNYIERIRPYFFNFHYENNAPGAKKKQWLDLTENCLKDLNRIEQETRELLREHKLIRQISQDHAIVIQAISKDVENAFSSRQLDGAYPTLGKAVKLSVVTQRGGTIVLSNRSEVNMHELLFDAQEALSGLTLSYKGHGGAGALTLSMQDRADVNFTPVLERVIHFFNTRAAELLKNRNTKNLIEVGKIHLPLIKEIFEKVRVHLYPHTAPEFLLRLKEDTTFEDSYTLQKRDAATIIKENEWLTTVEPLDFAMENRIIIPNQALKTLANDQFRGGLALSLMSNGLFNAGRVYTHEQLKNKDIPKMTLPIEKERQELIDYYKKHFKGRDYPLISVPREEAIAALKFTADGEKVFKHFEPVVIGLLLENKADSHVVIDVEADGAGDAECINFGASIYELEKDSGKVVNSEELKQLLTRAPEKIEHYHKLDDENYLINGRIKVSLLSQMIAFDADKKILPSVKVQNLTNITPEFLEETGISAEEAQRNILNVLSSKGRLIIQAHNLPYDNNISRVNFPELYQFMAKHTHLDSAVVAKEFHIAYTGVMVNNFGSGNSAIEFYNAEHPGYNLSTLMEDRNRTSFSYPSIKGNHILNVNGQDVSILDKRTMVSRKLELTRDELIPTLLPNLKPMQTPKYGIQKLLRMATIRDLIDHQPVKELRYVPFDNTGNAHLSDTLWHHFQTYYAFEKSIDENIAAFNVIPEVMDFCESRFELPAGSAPDLLLNARNAGNPDFDPGKSWTTKKAKEQHEKNANVFSGKDLLKMNSIIFLSQNQENANRYCHSWLYEIVLEQYEPTTKDVQSGFISGISDLTGVSPDMVEKIYEEVYRYKRFRGIESYHVHETHNNIGLEGDAYQEAVAFIHMLNLKRKNHFLVGEVGMMTGLSPIEPVVSTLSKQAASSTMKQIIREVVGISIDSDLFNSHSAKQLERYSDDGISAKQGRGENATIKCRTLSDSQTEVRIMLPKFDANAYRDLDKKARKSIETMMEQVASILTLANSIEKIKTEEGKKLALDIVTSESSLALLRQAREIFGEAVATEKESEMKKMLGRFADAIVYGEELKLSANFEIEPPSLKLCKEALKIGLRRLIEEHGFTPHIKEEQIEVAIQRLNEQYTINQRALKEGQPYHGEPGVELIGSEKSAQTRRLNRLLAVLQDHIDAFPELATTLLKQKNDPIEFIARSPLLAMLTSEVKPLSDIKLEHNALKLKR